VLTLVIQKTSSGVVFSGTCKHTPFVDRVQDKLNIILF
jgi:hypothetical protein